MANSRQAGKRARQAEKARKHNMAQRSLMRTKIKAVVKACDAGDKDAAVAAYKEAVPVIDSMINNMDAIVLFNWTLGNIPTIPI